MPRPNPPRKRPRRRRSAPRADAELTRQTAQSSQPRAQEPAPKRGIMSGGAGGGAAAAAAAVPEELWARRSYAILIALIALTEVVIGLILFGLAPGQKDVISLVAEMIGLQPFQPFPLLAACLLAAPVARRLSGEARALRFVETLIVGVVVYFLFIVFVTAAGFLLTPGGAGGTSNACATPSAHATPLPNTTESPSASASASASPSASGTPCPSPSPSPASGQGSPPASASGGASASASPASGTGSVASGTNLSPATVLTAAGGAWVAAYVLSVFIYPPLYRRLRVRRPPPGSDKPDGGGRGAGGGPKR